jgi:ribosomal protein L11 methyltransferase
MNRYPYLQVQATATHVEPVCDLLWELGATGVEERDDTTLLRTERNDSVTLVAHFESEHLAQQACEAVQSYDPTLSPSVQYVEGDAWRDAWKEYFKPTRIGSRLVVRPSWEPWDARNGEHVLTLDPGAAFGTGTHASTQLILRALQHVIQPSDTVLDVGCGSGILAIASLLFGAKNATAMDIDPMAARITAENAETNGVRDRIQVYSGPLTPRAPSAPAYSVVVANIELRPLQALAETLQSYVARAPLGHLLLSGLLLGHDDELLHQFSGWHVADRTVDGEWVMLHLRPPAVT